MRESLDSLRVCTVYPGRSTTRGWFHDRRISRLGAACVAIAGLLLGAHCSESDPDDGGSRLAISMTTSPPAIGTTDIVWLDTARSEGNVLVVDILARDISNPFDRFTVEIDTDPLVVEATAYTSGGQLETCTGLAVIPAFTVDAMGTIIVAESLPGAAPPGCTVAGTRTLGSVTFRGIAQGSTMPDFVPFNMDPNSPEGSRMERRTIVPPQIPVQFFDGGATIEVRRR